jgi:hypothetical protein
MPTKIPGHSLALMNVLAPLHISINDVLLSARSFIQCTPYDANEWQQRFNDQLFEFGHANPTWTHLQVRKSDLLGRWPRAGSRTQPERECFGWLVELMRASPSGKTKSRNQFMAEAERLFPKLRKRQFLRAWDKAIAETGAESWSKSGRLARKSNRSAS